MIYIGADHRGYNLKETLKIYLKELSYDCEDLGAKKLNPDDDYTDFALAVAEKIKENPDENRGILICGSGIGVDIAANKIKNVRSALCFDVKQAQMSRSNNNANVLSLPADFISEDLAKEIVKIWLETPFSGLERHIRRIEKIEAILMLAFFLFFMAPRANAVTIADLAAQIQALQVQLQQMQAAQGGVAAIATTAMATSATTCIFTKSLYLGVYDPQVKCLQQYLNMVGHTVSLSGVGSLGYESLYFGNKTKTAVAKWQAANGVSPASGYFGYISRTKYTAIIAATGGTILVPPTPTTPIAPAIPTTVNTTTTATPLSMITTDLPSAIAGENYLASISVSGGSGSYIWRVSAGSLPPGFNLAGGVCSDAFCQTGATTISGVTPKIWPYTFTVTVNSGSQAVSQVFIITVDAPAATLKLSQIDTINLNPGQTFEIKAFYTPVAICYPNTPCAVPSATQVRVNWTSSDNVVASAAFKYFDPTTGIITGRGAGNVTITAEYVVGDVNLSATVSVFVSGIINSSLIISPAGPTIVVGETVSLQAIYTPQYSCNDGVCATPGTETVQAVWISSNFAVASVAYDPENPLNAIVTGKASGVATITAGMGYSAAGSSLTASTAVMVTAPAIQ